MLQTWVRHPMRFFSYLREETSEQDSLSLLLKYSLTWPTVPGPVCGSPGLITHHAVLNI